MLGLLIFIPTLAYIPHWIYVITVPFLIWRHRGQMAGQIQQYLDKPGWIISKNFLIVLFIILASIVNRIVNYQNIVELENVFPFFILVGLTFFVARSLTRQDIKVLLACVLLECFVLGAEYLNGISTFFTGLEHFLVFKESDLWYDRQSLGLSENSSIVAVKIFLAYLLIDYIQLRGKWFWILKVAFMIGLFMTFNRTCILALVIYEVMQNIWKAIELKWTYDKLIIYGLAFFIVIAGISVFLFESMETLTNQFTRKTGTIELTGREAIWEYYIDFIKDNWAWGNGSYKVWFGEYHAHNSYLQLFATNGVFIFLLYIWFIIKNIRWTNMVFVLALALYSFTQYGFFWGISLMDICLFLFLMRPDDDEALYGQPPKKVLETSKS